MLSIAALTGCSEQTAGTPVVASSSAAQVATVSQPLNPTPFLNRPCDLIPQTLLNQLGYTDPGEPKTGADSATAEGPTCRWLQPSSSKLINIGIQRAPDGSDNGGLRNVFAAKGSLFSFVEPTEISSYPAAFADTGDHRPEGDCGLYVGITDTLTMSASAHEYRGAQDSCDTARQIAAAMIQSLKGGS
jgi:hypothetical protein